MLPWARFTSRWRRASVTAFRWARQCATGNAFLVFAPKGSQDQLDAVDFLQARAVKAARHQQRNSATALWRLTNAARKGHVALAKAAAGFDKFRRTIPGCDAR